MATINRPELWRKSSRADRKAKSSRVHVFWNLDRIRTCIYFSESRCANSFSQEASVLGHRIAQACRMGRQPRWNSREDVTCCRLFVSVSEDSVVGTQQILATLEGRVESAFKRIIPPAVIGTGLSVWLARSGRFIVHRFKLLKASCLKYQCKLRLVISASMSGVCETDVSRVAQMLYNGNGTMVGAYKCVKDTDYSVGPVFPHK